MTNYDRYDLFALIWLLKIELADVSDYNKHANNEKKWKVNSIIK